MILPLVAFVAFLGLLKASSRGGAPKAYNPKTDAIVPVDVQPSEPTRPRDPSKPSDPSKPTQIIPQPKGATGNLPNETRPLGTSNFNPERAHGLAPDVYRALTKAPQTARAILIEFQKAADMQPADGVYGPRSAGALAYFLPRDGQPTPKVPQPFTADKRIIPYRI